MVEPIQEISVGSGLIVSPQRLFLLVKANTGAGKGLWNNPGGRQNTEGQNETIQECALREIEEESGIQPSKLDKHIATYYFFPNPKILVRKQVFLVTKYSGEPRAQLGEIEKVQWFSAEEIKQNPLEFTQGVVDSVDRYLSQDFGGAYRSERIA